VDEKLGRGSASFARATEPVDEEALARFVRAFEDGDIDGLVAALHRDVRTTMPPIPTWLEGFAANELFYRRMLSNMRPGRIRMVRTAANGQTALALFRPDGETGPRTLHAIDVVTTQDGKIRTVDHFMTKAVFPLFGLPAEV
jgi:RNA polymerase sigma-70 factor (ECF subfamily)